MTFAEKLQRLLKDEHWSQQQLAQELGVSQNQISSWVCGKTLPDLGQGVRIARIFGVSLEWLASEEAGFPALPPALTAEQVGLAMMRLDLVRDALNGQVKPSPYTNGVVIGKAERRTDPVTRRKGG